MRNPAVRATGRVLVPPCAAQFGVISDIDDTIVYSQDRFPERIRVIYIRSVDPAAARIKSIERLVAQVALANVRADKKADLARSQLAEMG